ncbi:hypothetical protein [Arthrobacter sp. Ld5]|uniref:hypothetical protein n=1 Tax=Arthrobacter sp. Ld5 TaxID=649152 RepID=UPI003EC0179D
MRIKSAASNAWAKTRALASWLGVSFVIGLVLGAGVYTVLREMVEDGDLPGTGMGLKDWASFFLALLAFILSFTAFIYSQLKAKRDAFLAIHEKLIAYDIQEGRRILFTKIHSVDDVKRLEQENLDEFQEVNRALAMYDVLAMYASRKYVPKQVILDEWGRNLARSRKHALHFMEHRDKKWDHYDKLSSEALATYGTGGAEKIPETK